ncbi:MAG TPA: hypothetical protein VLC28_01165 [Flavitalea sp.]|nr:hypothetical protein [Flavitalea sp.]
MKKIFIAFILIASCSGGFAQDFAKRVSEARTAYSAGKLDDARFAMQQALQELDMAVGKEILKLLPEKLVDQAANTATDNVAGASGFVGVIVHRDYGPAPDASKIEIITNSPLIGTLNALMAVPMLANNADQKVIRIHGYKALLTKNSSTGAEKPNFQIQMPLQSSMIMIDAPGKTADQITKIAEGLPVEQIAKLIQ